MELSMTDTRCGKEFTQIGKASLCLEKEFSQAEAIYWYSLPVDSSQSVKLGHQSFFNGW
jgi:hypothetical protein